MNHEQNQSLVKPFLRKFTFNMMQQLNYLVIVYKHVMKIKAKRGHCK